MKVGWLVWGLVALACGESTRTPGARQTNGAGRSGAAGAANGSGGLNAAGRGEDGAGTHAGTNAGLGGLNSAGAANHAAGGTAGTTAGTNATGGTSSGGAAPNDAGGDAPEAGTGGEGGDAPGCNANALVELRADGYDQSAAKALSADGTYSAGRVWNGTGLAHTGVAGVRFSDAQATLLETNADWDRVEPTAISADGSVLVGVVSTTGSSAAFISDGIHVRELPVPVTGDTGVSMATAISGDGTTVVGLALDGSSEQVPVRWRGDDIVTLPVPKGLGAVSPGAVSTDGAVIMGTGVTANNETEGVRWTNGSVMALGDVNVEVDAMSDDGNVMVGNEATTASTGGYRAVRYDADGLAYLPPPEDGPWNCLAAATNGDGSIVLGLCTNLPDHRVFLWSPERASVTLDSVALTLGVDLTPYSGLQPIDVSRDGTTVLLNATRDGRMVALRLRIGCAFP